MGKSHNSRKGIKNSTKSNPEAYEWGKDRIKRREKKEIILSSVRPGRQGVKIGNLLMNQLKKWEQIEFTLIDPLEYDIPLTMAPLHFMKPEEKKPEFLVKLNQILSDSDCYFIVGGEYNNTIQPALTNLLDHFSPSIFQHKVSGLCCYSGGTYAVAKAVCIPQIG
eukprot:gene11829-5160_t